jgi:hypothetical protein
MSLGIYCQAPFNNASAWEAFALAHYLRHQTIANAINGPVTQSKLDDIATDKTGWMLDHAQTHLDICNALGINANPDLGETNLKDMASYQQWMQIHWTEHDLIDQALNL